MNHTPYARSTQAAGSNIGLVSVFGSTLFQLSGIFMLSPLLLLMLNKAGVSTSVAGLFAATTWLGIFIITPFASQLTQKIGRRQTMWLASTMPIVAAAGFILRHLARPVDTLVPMPPWSA
jgi:predicted MFS family arabinose efflux permease